MGGNLDSNAFSQRLNDRGEEGWELVSIFDTHLHNGNTRDVVAVFKRSRVIPKII